eukprot:405002-Pleurochrysis_carterae.AAC.1
MANTQSLYINKPDKQTTISILFWAGKSYSRRTRCFLCFVTQRTSGAAKECAKLIDMRLYARVHLPGCFARNCSRASRSQRVVDSHDLTRAKAIDFADVGCCQTDATGA